jgi:hypothetical protein
MERDVKLLREASDALGFRGIVVMDSWYMIELGYLSIRAIGCFDTLLTGYEPRRFHYLLHVDMSTSIEYVNVIRSIVLSFAVSEGSNSQGLMNTTADSLVSPPTSTSEALPSSAVIASTGAADTSVPSAFEDDAPSHGVKEVLGVLPSFWVFVVGLRSLKSWC